MKFSKKFDKIEKQYLELKERNAKEILDTETAILETKSKKEAAESRASACAAAGNESEYMTAKTEIKYCEDRLLYLGKFLEALRSNPFIDKDSAENMIKDIKEERVLLDQAVSGALMTKYADLIRDAEELRDKYLLLKKAEEKLQAVVRRDSVSVSAPGIPGIINNICRAAAMDAAKGNLQGFISDYGQLCSPEQAAEIKERMNRWEP